MMDLKTYGYTEIDAIQDGLLPGRVADGSLSRERWEHYVAQQHENKYVQDRTSYLIDKRARNKTIVIQSKQTKNNGGWKNEY
ncbi:hypothetical protein [Paenibacillus pabuli]|uniref:hypothetical protein n=1 Tax=Paenibacillus pabuli TaxID=1472 RepID=UPI0007853A27|nr:hypothetical protein [Paenibacillus pabuli]MEC0124576.1 hypothetical protein [Paenibacillus pabuli]